MSATRTVRLSVSRGGRGIDGSHPMDEVVIWIMSCRAGGSAASHNEVVMIVYKYPCGIVCCEGGMVMHWVCIRCVNSQLLRSRL